MSSGVYFSRHSTTFTCLILVAQVNPRQPYAIELKEKSANNKVERILLLYSAHRIKTQVIMF